MNSATDFSQRLLGQQEPDGEASRKKMPPCKLPVSAVYKSSHRRYSPLAKRPTSRFSSNKIARPRHPILPPKWSSWKFFDVNDEGKTSIYPTWVRRPEPTFTPELRRRVRMDLLENEKYMEMARYRDNVKMRFYQNDQHTPIIDAPYKYVPPCPSKSHVCLANPCGPCPSSTRTVRRLIRLLQTSR